MPPKFGLVAFDLDGTLVAETSSWYVLHEHFGTRDSAAKNLEAYKNGAIDYPEFMRRDISLWPRVHHSEVDALLSKFTLAEGAEETVKGLKMKGYKIAIVSSGIDVLANKVARVLDIPYVLANGLELDRDGRLTGRGVFRVPLSQKEKALEPLARRFGLGLRQCVAVGDSDWDFSFLASSGLGVACRYAGGELDKVAELSINDLRELLEHV